MRAINKEKHAGANMMLFPVVLVNFFKKNKTKQKKKILPV
jgi:hypothetical protein